LYDPRVSLVIVGVDGTNGLAKCARKDGGENGRVFFDEHKTRVVDGFKMNFVDTRDVNGHFIFGLRNDDLDTLSKCQNGNEKKELAYLQNVFADVCGITLDKFVVRNLRVEGTSFFDLDGRRKEANANEARNALRQQCKNFREKN
jgi:hypothetical protein